MKRFLFLSILGKCLRIGNCGMIGNCVIFLYCFNEIILKGVDRGLYFVSLGCVGVWISFLMLFVIIFVCLFVRNFCLIFYNIKIYLMYCKKIFIL